MMELEPAEDEIIEHLAAAWNLHAALPVQHPSDAAEMMDAIHRAQHLVMVRPTRRANPDIFVDMTRSTQ